MFTRPFYRERELEINYAVIIAPDVRFNEMKKKQFILS
jgi:hypothetical protein